MYAGNYWRYTGGQERTRRLSGRPSGERKELVGAAERHQWPRVVGSTRNRRWGWSHGVLERSR